MDFLKKICDDAHTTLLVQDCPQDTCVIDDLLFIRYQKKEVVESFCSSTVSETESIGLTSESSLPSAPNLLLATRRQRRNGVSTGPRQRRMGCGAAPDPTELHTSQNLSNSSETESADQRLRSEGRRNL
eukprot:GHVP01061537.1.p1 GENE.GHVP01061537.1~~GHVP01061537.1.p1  ORF type:complete len:136 (+),score=24.69 GHVP01061537.1:22-408(+)